MKITNIVGTPVTVPMEAPLRWSMGVETGTTRTIIRISTDEGLTGIGETYGGDATVHALEFAKPFILGMDPLEVQSIVRKLQSFRISYESHLSPHVIGGIEVACWDVAGKALNRPVSSLLGGTTRSEIPFAAYLFYRYTRGEHNIGGEASAEAIVDRCQELVDKHGFPGYQAKRRSIAARGRTREHAKTSRAISPSLPTSF